MDLAKTMKQLLPELGQLDVPGRFARKKAGCFSGARPPFGGSWKHATSSYFVKAEDMELGSEGLVSLLLEKRTAAMADLEKFLEKQVGKAKKFCVLEGEYLTETLLFGQNVKAEPRVVTIRAEDDSGVPADGAVVIIDLTYSFA